MFFWAVSDIFNDPQNLFYCKKKKKDSNEFYFNLK